MSKHSVERFGEELRELFGDNKMVVFLCGPTLKKKRLGPGAKLRKKLQQLLEERGFEVVLGEDDGLEWLRKRYLQMAHLNEIAFIERECGAIVLIADSVGSYCELGLFSYVHPSNSNRTDFIVIIDEKYRPDNSYLNEGPAKAVQSHGLVIYANFQKFDPIDLITRLESRRAIFVHDGRGRPKISP